MRYVIFYLPKSSIKKFISIRLSMVNAVEIQHAILQSIVFMLPVSYKTHPLITKRRSGGKEKGK